MLNWGVSTSPQESQRVSELVVSFDLDGTLVRSPAGSAMRSVTAGWGDDAWADVLAEHERLLRFSPLAAYDWAAIVAREAARRGQPFDGDLVTPLLRAIDERGVRLLHDGTHEHLDALRALGARVVVLTNGRREFQQPVLEAAGLLDRIDALVTCDDVGAVKPDAAMFATARGAATRHVHVGDRLDHDVAGALASGATGVLLRTDAPTDAVDLPEFLRRVRLSEGESAPEVIPDAVLHRLDEVVELVALG